MPVIRYNLQSQSIYSELVQALEVAENEGLSNREGSFVRREIKSRAYWYRRRRVGNRIQEDYLGPDTEELRSRLDSLRKDASEAKSASRHRRSLIRMLRSAGYLMTDRRSGRILEELALARVFRANGVLIGTHAFRCYSAILGVGFGQELAATNDLDLAQDRALALGITNASSPSLEDALTKAEKFVRVPGLDHRKPATSWRTADHQLRVDLLTPLLGRSRDTQVELPALGAHATPLRFLDFLLAETIPAAALTGSGVLVRVPSPERFALHKLIVSQRRGQTDRDKTQKDLAQARILLEVLLETQPEDLVDGWHELKGRGKSWETTAQKAGHLLPEELWSRFLELATLG